MHRRTLLAMPAFAALPARAQTWPSRQITLVVPLAPGSTADIMARALAEKIAPRLGQAVVVDNRPAAGGIVALQQLARAEPDGHIFGLISQGTQVFNPLIHRTPGYDPLADFAAITPAATVSNVLIVPPRSPFTTLADVLAAARANPGKLTYSSGGVGTSHHLSSVLLAHMAKLDVVHVPYRGAPAGIQAVMSAEVDFAFYNTPTVITQIRDGLLKGLAVTSPARSALLPDLPTMKEAGQPDYEIVTWMGFAAPARAPRAAVERLNAELAAALADASVRERMSRLGFEFSPPASPDAFAQFIARDLDHWRPILAAANVRAE
jgi:tripartite-type tricarboxylate transporter receptor subunit TctC